MSRVPLTSGDETKLAPSGGSVQLLPADIILLPVGVGSVDSGGEVNLRCVK